MLTQKTDASKKDYGRPDDSLKKQNTQHLARNEKYQQNYSKQFGKAERHERTMEQMITAQKERADDISFPGQSFDQPNKYKKAKSLARPKKIDRSGFKRRASPSKDRLPSRTGEGWRPATLPSAEAEVDYLQAMERQAELADFDRDEKFLKNYAKRHFATDEPTTGAAAQRQAAIDVLRHWSAGEMGICTPAMPAEGGEEEAAAVALGMAGKAAAWEAADARALAVASTRAFVELSPGEADEIDLSLEEAWEGGEEDDEDEGEEEEEDEDGEGEEEEGEEKEGEEMEEDGEEEME